MARKLRHPLLAFVLGAALVAAAFGGRAAYASFAGGDVIRACYKGNGTLYVVGAPGAPATCGVGDVPLQWGVQGPPGVFTGTYRSPNGQFVLAVTDRGVRMGGPGGVVEVGSHGVRMTGVHYAKVGARQVHLGGKCRRISGTLKVYGC